MPNACILLDLLFLENRFRTPKAKNQLNEYLSNQNFEELEKKFEEKTLINNIGREIIQKIKEIDSRNLTKLKSIIDTVVPY